MSKFVLLFCLMMIAATVVNCSKSSHKNHENVHPQREDVQIQQLLEQRSQIVGTGLTGRLASGYPGPAVGRRFPSVHEHVSGHKRCRNGAQC